MRVVLLLPTILLSSGAGEVAEVDAGRWGIRVESMNCLAGWRGRAAFAGTSRQLGFLTSRVQGNDTDHHIHMLRPPQLLGFSLLLTHEFH